MTWLAKVFHGKSNPTAHDPANDAPRAPELWPLPQADAAFSCAEEAALNRGLCDYIEWENARRLRGAAQMQAAKPAPREEIWALSLAGRFLQQEPVRTAFSAMTRDLVPEKDAPLGAFLASQRCVRCGAGETAFLPAYLAHYAGGERALRLLRYEAMSAVVRGNTAVLSNGALQLEIVFSTVVQAQNFTSAYARYAALLSGRLPEAVEGLLCHDEKLLQNENILFFCAQKRLQAVLKRVEARRAQAAAAQAGSAPQAMREEQNVVPHPAKADPDAQARIEAAQKAREAAEKAAAAEKERREKAEIALRDMDARCAAEKEGRAGAEASLAKMRVLSRLEQVARKRMEARLQELEVAGAQAQAAQREIASRLRAAEARFAAEKERTQDALREAELRAAAAQTACREAEAQLAAAQASKRELESELRGAREEKERAEAAQAGMEARLAEAEAARKRAEEEQRDAESRAQEAQRAKEEMAAILARGTAERDSAQSACREAEAQLAAAQASKRELEAELRGAREEKERAEAAQSAVEARLAEAEAARKRAEEEQRDAESRAQEAQRAKEEMEAILARGTAERDSAQSACREAEERLAAAQASKRELESELRGAREEKERAEAAQSAAETRLAAEESARQEAEARAAEVGAAHEKAMRTLRKLAEHWKRRKTAAAAESSAQAEPEASEEAESGRLNAEMIARLRQAQAEASTRQEQRLIQETTERMERQIEALESGSEEEVRRKKEFQRCSTFTGSTLLNWYGSEANLVVPDGLLTIIGVGAFKWRANLASVQLPPSVRRVGDGAFSFCKKLKCVHLAETTTSFGREAFKGCASLDEIELPQGVTYISEEMFAKCEALEEIHLPEGVETIASGAFAGCRALKRVTLPASLKKIGKSAFSGCFSLQEIEIPEGVRVIEERAFGNCRALAHVRLPRTLQTLGREAFIGCTSLRAADMGLLARVPERCFFGDAELEEVALCAQTERIQEQAFARCTALRRLTRAEEPSADFRGEMLQYIDKFALADCRSLRGVSLREGLREIGEGAFLRCNALKSVSLPSSLQALGKGAFASCAALKDVEGLQPGRFSEECFRNTPYLVGFGPFVIREGKLVAYNGQEARVFIPKTVRVIGEKAFAGNRGLNVVNMGLSVEEIEEKAFADCPNLQKIYIPESVQRIADDAFRNDRSFTIQCARGSEAASFRNRHKISVEWVAPTRQIPQNGSAKDEVLPWTKATEERRTPPISSLWEQLRGRGETAAPTPGTQALRPPHSALMQNAAAWTQQGRLPAAGPRQAPLQSAPPPRARIEYEVVAPDEGKTSLQLLEDRRVITNNLFSLRLAQPEDSDGRAIGEYEVFLADAFGKPVSETRAVRADKSGEERTHKVTLSLLPGIQTDKSAEYFVIVREKGQSTRVLSRTKYQVNITFAMKF